MSEQQIPDESPKLPPDQSEPHSEGAVAPDVRTPFFKPESTEGGRCVSVLEWQGGAPALLG